ncbi:hypothetical protein N1851_026851 [Merluccius polli]|uniref:Uncharacterized protein n=1 Tax=Merluccius polli TaxID=89951 RepID=A0AA47NTN7_MERPO|nr:hypothetical protein N1851_026851 [Merluccius polli]
MLLRPLRRISSSLERIAAAMESGPPNAPPPPVVPLPPPPTPSPSTRSTRGTSRIATGPRRVQSRRSVTGNWMYCPACRTRPNCMYSRTYGRLRNASNGAKGVLERPRRIEIQRRCNFHCNGEGIGTGCISPQLICQEMANICHSLTAQA